jgi:hypothetical protein
MTIQLYKAATGEKALVVNHQLILDGELKTTALRWLS